MKKQLLWLTIIAVVLLTGSSGCQQRKNGSKDSLVEEALPDSFLIYREQVQAGDMTAYLKLADLWMQEDNIENGTLWALIMASMAEEWGVVKSWESWGLSKPEDTPVHLVTEVFTDVADHRFDDALSKNRKLINMGFHRDLVKTLVAIEKKERYKTLRLSQQMAKDGSLVGRLLYCIFSDDKEATLDLADEVPILYLTLAEEALNEGKDPDEVDERVPLYYKKADEYGFLNREGADYLLHYYEYLERKDSCSVPQEELDRLKQILNQ